MTPKTPSLTAYDFLGYTVPGFACLLLVDLSIIYHADNINITYDYLCSRYTNVKLGGVIPILLLSYLVGHILGFCSSVLVERHSTWVYGNPTRFLLGIEVQANYFKTGGGSANWSVFFRVITALSLLPISVFDLIFKKFIPLSSNYIIPLDPLLIKASAKATIELFKNIGLPDNTSLSKEDSIKNIDSLDVHRFTVHCALESAPNHVSSLRNYVVLYGFLRSIALLAVVIFWGLLLHLNGILIWWEVTMWCALAALFSYVIYAAFLKFRIRYHKEGIMAVIASCAISKKC